MLAYLKDRLRLIADLSQILRYVGSEIIVFSARLICVVVLVACSVPNGLLSYSAEIKIGS